MACFFFIACGSAKTEGFLFDSHTMTDYLEVEVEGLNKRFDELTSCNWVKFKYPSLFSEIVVCALGYQFCLGRRSDKLYMEMGGAYR